jgi:outer membrane lipoprotein-sorting protein
MKSIKLSILALLVVTAGFVTAGAQTADEIIQKHITAIGGADNWKKLSSMKMSGSINAGGTELVMTMTVVHNKAMKQEMTINGMTGYTIITKTKGWTFAPYGGQTKPEAMTEAMVKDQQEELDIQGGFLDYKTKGRKVTYLGKDDVEGTECYKIKLVYPTGKEETDYIDASTYYLIKTVKKIKADGKESEQAVNLSNYKKLPEGIVMPMSFEAGGGAFTIKSIDINKPVDESLFVPKG